MQNSKLIFPDINEIQLNIKLNDFIDYKEALFNVLNSLEERLALNWKPKNMFQLKSFLSQIMLVPCLFYSALNNKGIFKRESFEAVKINFTEQEWKPIKIASQVRKDWDKELNFFQSFLLKQTNTLLRKIIRKYVAPRINSKTKEKLNSEFYENLSKLIQKIKIDIQ